MPGFLIDANLPYRFSLWQYAKQRDLTIVTKDADFSDWIMLAEPPPRIIHLRIGNMRIRELFAFLHRVWPRVEALSTSNKLVIVGATLIECIA
jgi:predicted nuclease of predicted toxin-antitoxin system